jgi:hypothetical protein
MRNTSARHQFTLSQSISGQAWRLADKLDEAHTNFSMNPRKGGNYSQFRKMEMQVPAFPLLPI